SVRKVDQSGLLIRSLSPILMSPRPRLAAALGRSSGRQHARTVLIGHSRATARSDAAKFKLSHAYDEPYAHPTAMLRLALYIIRPAGRRFRSRACAQPPRLGLS